MKDGCGCGPELYPIKQRIDMGGFEVVVELPEGMKIKEIKILMGDVSDNIPPICAKVGPKTAFKIANMSHEDRSAWIKAKGPACVAQYNTNTLLVSFASIPEDLAQAFYTKYTFITI